MRRVVVTGLGLVTPLGGDVETSWRNILAAKSGAGRITRFDPTDYACQIACEVKPAGHDYGFDANKRIDHKIQRQVDLFIIFGIDAAGQAIEDAGLTDMSEADRLRAGCSIGSGIGGLPGIESESIVLYEKGPRRVSPHFVHGRLINLISGQVSIKYGLMGPNHAVVTACSTGAHSIGDAGRMIALGDADVMLAGGLRDFTRIASSDPVMWRDICLANRDAILDMLKQYRAEVDGLLAAVAAGDGAALEDLFARAKAARDALATNDVKKE